jgi:signal transduction histidine kinase
MAGDTIASIDYVINNLITVCRKKIHNQEQLIPLAEKNFLNAVTIIKNKKNMECINEIENFFEITYDKLSINGMYLTKKTFLALVKILSIVYFEYLNNSINNIKLKKEYSEENLRRGIIAAQENERRKISVILHDDVVQSLASILMRLQLLGEMVKGENHYSYEIRQELVDIENILRGIITQCRLIAVDHDMLLLDNAGFIPALNSYILEFKNKNGIDIITDLPEQELIKSPLNLHFFYIIREALINVQKHAEASLVFIKIKKSSFEYMLTIKDNGKGFINNNIEKMPSSEHLGLYCIYQRVKMLKGNLDICSSPGKGTKIIVTIPIEKNKYKRFVPEDKGRSPWVR